MFDLLLEPNPDQKYKVPSENELIDHAFLFAITGTDTTSMALTFAVFYVLSSPDILVCLLDELREASPYIRDEFNWKEV